MTFAKRNILRKIPTGPNPKPSNYVDVLGSKLRVLFRAPRGVFGNGVLAQSWTDEVSETAVPRVGGTPTLALDGSNFGGKPVVVMPGNDRFEREFDAPLVGAAEYPEIFAVFRASLINASIRPIISLISAAGTSQLGIVTNNDQLRVTAGGTTSGGAAFTDVIGVHFFSGRINPTTSLRIVNLDGVDTESGGAAPALQSCRTLRIGAPTSFAGALALAGFVNPAMTAEERAEFIRIAREEFSF